MSVTFVIPPSGFLIDAKVFPSLGVLKVAAVLEQRGMAVDVLDLSGVSDVHREVSAHVAKHTSQFYGITATSPQMPAAAAIADQLSALAPQSRVILGGPHVTLMQASARQELKRGEPSRACEAMDRLHEHFDVLVCGDGEHAIEVALHPDAPKLIDVDDPKCGMFLKSEELGELPLAARHLIDLNSYHYSIDGVRANSVIGQLGCPMGCAFCGGRRSPFLRKIRTRSTEAVIAELRHLYLTYGTRGFMFLDDELNVNRQFLELLQAMRRLQDSLGVEFRMRGFLKAELITEPMAAAMFMAGFRQVLVGFESGSERILSNIQKRATQADNTRAIETLHAQGLNVKALMSLGHPGESDETIEETRSWLLATRPEEFDATIITVYPGTPYYDDARELTPGIWTYADPKTGDKLHAYPVDHLKDESFYKGIPGQYQSFVYTDALSAEQLCERRDALEADVRSALAIPYPVASPSLSFEQSMGMSGAR